MSRRKLFEANDNGDHGLKRARLAIHDTLVELIDDKSVHAGSIGAALADELAWVIAMFVKEGQGPAQVEAKCQMVRDQFAKYVADPNLLRPEGWGSPLPT